METIVFTNGCFDIIHPGHIDLLKKARGFGTKLVVGINSDRSVREIKGTPRPFVDQNSRAAILKELRSVDEVRIFDENTPERLIREINPRVLVKGGDWLPGQIVGAAYVLKNGGRVFSIPFEREISTTRIVEKIRTASDATRFPSAADDPPHSESAFPSAIDKIFSAEQITSIEKASKIISKTARRNGKIGFAATERSRRTADRLAEDLTNCYGGRHFVKSDAAAQSRILIQANDLLIAIGDRGDSAELAAAVMEARATATQIIVLTGAEGRNLAALSDVCVLLAAGSDEELFWQQSAIGYLWCLKAKAQIQTRS